MLFTGLEFLYFTLAFLAVFPFVRKVPRAHQICITLFSYAFYAFGDFSHLPLLLLIGLINYALAHLIVKRPQEKLLFHYLSLALNLGLLIWAKFHFSRTGELPLGVSFYTFQAMSYTIDVWRGVAPLPRSLWHFQAYLFFFPQLVAGPICRANDLLLKLTAPLPSPSVDQLRSGVYLLTFGLLKKAVIADALAQRIDPLFTDFLSIKDPLSWSLIIVAYGWQIYFDFSGYTDMARGIGKLIGVELPLNFNFPYFARSLQDFWHRWHISLSQWFRDYIYLPLGGSKNGNRTFLTAVFASFLLSALWHGIGLNYLVWGLWHGVFLVFLRSKGGRPITLLVVFIGWIFFRARDEGQLTHLLSTIGNFSDIRLGGVWRRYSDLFYLSLIAFGIDLGAAWFRANFRRLGTWGADFIWLSATLIALTLQSPAREFIYFRF